VSADQLATFAAFGVLGLLVVVVALAVAQRWRP
jgi:hypothetical protein